METLALSATQAALSPTGATDFTTSRLSSVRAPGDTEGTPSASFADVLVARGEEVVQSLNKAETTSIAGIKGDATAYEVATTVMDAQQQLRMTVAVRDRIVQSYLDITRMQI